MARLAFAPIVEGHGEDQAFPILLRRLWTHMGGEYIEVLRPSRGRRDKLIRAGDGELQKLVGHAANKLAFADDVDAKLILLLVDTEGECAKKVADKILPRLSELGGGFDTAFVAPHFMYETWFVGAAESLARYLDCDVGDIPANPESVGAGKTWVRQHRRGGRYSETIDQPAMTATMDLALCRTACPSFDKLWREIARYT